MAEPLLGWIAPQDRTNEQNDAHAKALAKMPRFSMPPAKTAGPVKVILTDYWKHPDVIADIGFEFTGFRQLSGACVGVSCGNWITTLACIQRVISDTPTKAFVAFWPFLYGRCRLNEGDRGQGEGAVDSVMGDTVAKDGYFDVTQQGLPQFDKSDGLALTRSIEMQWSDGASPIVTKWQSLASQHVGAKATINSVQDIKTAIINGYPVIDGCDMYVGNGSIKGNGENAYVTGRYDGRGGHSTCILAYMDHPNDGPLYGYSNQWDGSTYPKDPAGLGRCCVWLPESEVEKGFSRYGMSGGETIALSHVDYFPSQPRVLQSFV